MSLKETSSSREFGSNSEAPTVKQINDVFLVGVNHRAIVGENPPQDYLRAVASADHLLLEGNRASYQVPVKNYEELAHEFFRRKIGEGSTHFLEEDVDREQLLMQFGMPGEVTKYYSAYGSLIAGLARGWHRDRSMMEDEVPRVADLLKQRSSVFSEMTDKQLHTQLHAWVDGLMEARKKGEDVGSDGAIAIQVGYERQIRESQIFAPRVTELAKNLPGTKTVFVGKNHMPAVEGVLQGGLPEQPKSWSEYVQDLDPNKRAALEAFSSLAKPVKNKTMLQ